MPKLSISVGEDLWQQAVDASGETSPSAVVQAALRRMVALEASAPFSPTVEAQARVESVASARRAEAEEHYREGYEHGIFLAEHQLTWEELDWAAEFQFNFKELARAVLERANRDDYDPEVDYQGALSLSQEGRGAIFEQGIAAALRDVWRATIERKAAE